MDFGYGSIKVFRAKSYIANKDLGKDFNKNYFNFYTLET
jgi:hypothetical protein